MNLEGIETLILASVCNSEEAAHALIPHIKPEYFESEPHRLVYLQAYGFISSFNQIPPKEALSIALSKINTTENNYQSCEEIIGNLYKEDSAQIYQKSKEWLMKEAEQWCIDRSVFLGVMSAISILDGKPVNGKKLEKGAIPKLLQDALSVSFNQSIGHDFSDDAEARYEFYHLKEKKISSGLRELDNVLKGGFANKTLTGLLGGTGSGKTTVMCSIAANCYKAGENVLYISCEMSEERIAERLDANLMDVGLDSLTHLPRDTYMKKILTLRGQTTGRILIKEYPPGYCTANHIRALLDELKLKKGFIPTIIFVDYLAIMKSCSVPSKESMYLYVKSIAEELRAVGVERDLPIVTGAQTNRDGQYDADLDLTQVGESHGLSATLDYFLAIITTDQLEQMMQLRIKQLKNRHGAIDKPRSFLVGLDRSKMRLYDLSTNESQLKGLPADTPVLNRFTRPSSATGVRKTTDDWTV